LLQRENGENGGPERFYLSLCNSLPEGGHRGNCTFVYDSSMPAAGSYGSAGARKRAATAADDDGKRVVSGKPTAHFDAQGKFDGVSLAVKGSDRVVFLDERCTRVLVYPDQTFKNAKREELSFIGSQFWLFSVSLYAVRVY
jgi:hypothetical protein